MAALDLAVFTALLYLTSGADSPFFSPFVFLILSATIQWGSRGAAIMGLLTIAALAPAGGSLAFGTEDPGAGQVLLLRLGYTAVVTVMLMAFGRHIERVVEELARLSDPVADAPADQDPPIREGLRHALWVFGAARGAFLWGETDEPYSTLAVLSDGRFSAEVLPPQAEPWVDPELSDAVFLLHAPSGSTLVRKGHGAAPGPNAPLSAAVMALIPFERALVIPASTRSLTGWILVLDHEDAANEDLAIGAMVSAQVSVALERWETQRERRAAAAAEDRIQLARDLHDGVLQFLAGAGLQLDGLAKSATLPQDAAERIGILRRAIADEQKELRGLIAAMRPSRGKGGSARRALADELSQLAERLSHHWTVEVKAQVRPADVSVSERVAFDLSRLVREAVANAVRHGGARRVQVSACADAGRLVVRIDDNGRGFAFEGEVDGDDPATPRSLRERVRAMAGRLELHSSPKGARVTIDVPLEAAG
jgi:signal transduction histidine kinase